MGKEDKEGVGGKERISLHSQWEKKKKKPCYKMYYRNTFIM